MKHKILIVSLLLIQHISLSAQDSLALDGNGLYAKGEYIQAIEVYSKQLNSNLTDRSRAILYYNLGNSYFKINELAQAILYYERSLRLYPTFKDAKYNLLFAQNSIVDNIEDNHTFVTQWATSIRNLLSEKVWTIMSTLCFFIFLIGMLFFAFSPKVGIRKIAFYTGFVCVALSVIAFANGYSLHQRDTLRSEAIITQGIVNAKSSPDKSGTDLFTLHEGTKVTIHELIGDWVNIHVGNNVGWINVANLERI